MGGVEIFLSGMAAGAFLGALTVIVIALVMGENPVKIIRWSGPVTFPSGEVGYMICRSGSLEECREYAEQVAKEFGVTVEAVI